MKLHSTEEIDETQLRVGSKILSNENLEPNVTAGTVFEVVDINDNNRLVTVRHGYFVIEKLMFKIKEWFYIAKY